MTQLQTGPRRPARPTMDVYTGLALAGTFALIVGVVILWLNGTKLASESSAPASHPFTVLPDR